MRNFLNKNHQTITFTDIRGVAKKYYPQPAANFLPTWFKDQLAYPTGKKEVLDGYAQRTVKKCLPFFDVMTAGYIIPTWTDIYVKQTSEGIVYQVPNQSMIIEFHTGSQAQEYPKRRDNLIPKFLTPWVIQTPKDYSTMFVNPFHNPNDFVEIIEGLVDTDNYTAPVNFPFQLKDIKFEGLIPAGTPIVQVIPVKRDKWKISYNDKALEERSQQDGRLVSAHWFESYKNNFWTRKQYD